MTVGDILKKIDELAPFALQESFDNSGLLIGSKEAEVTAVLVCLDVTPKVLEEAISARAELIISHHPLMFSPVQSITADDYEGRIISGLIRSGISLIAAHTNLDRAAHGVSMVLAECCGLNDIEGEQYVRVGRLPEAMTVGCLAQRIGMALGDAVRIMGDSQKKISRVAVVSGAGGDFWQEAKECGAEAFVTGEIKHHHALAAVDAGLVLYEAGHYATECPGIFALADTLQNWSDAVQYKVRFVKSQVGRYSA